MKVDSLSGAALDWAVAKCEGIYFSVQGDKGLKQVYREYHPYIWEDYSPSTNWAQGGPIIEREKIATGCPSSGDFWDARDSKTFLSNPVYWRASTPLVAAMRCYVASKLGEDIDIPEELL